MPHVEVEPAAAERVFGPRVPLARAFATALVEHGEERGLIGPLEAARIWSRHILNCAVVAPLLRPGLVADVGSGAGLPGIALAIARPDVNFVLIEPMERRAVWLREQSAALGLENVEVLRARAEEARLPHRAEQVTARAVSAFRKLIPWVAPLARDGGELVLIKGSNAQAEIDAAAKQIARYRLSRVRVEIVGEGLVDEVTRVIRATVR